jgi:hypothetical protein
MPHDREIPSTPATDPNPAAGAAQALRRTSVSQHAVRASATALAVALVWAGSTVVLAQKGTRTCEHIAGFGGTEHDICVERQYYPFTAHVRSEVTTMDGVPHGLRREWHPNGQPWLWGAYAAGERTGAWTEWHDNGAMRFRGEYRGDRLEGTETWWYPNGHAEWQVARTAGKREGVELWWYESGKLRRLGTYHEGEKDGTFTVYGEDGRPAFSGAYTNGVEAPPA